MFHVHCKLPNASHHISGVKFRDHDKGGVITAEPVDAAAVAKFEGIPGYIVIDLDKKKPRAPKAAGGNAALDASPDGAGSENGPDSSAVEADQGAGSETGTLV